MQKIAVFTEGLTEQLFVAEVIRFLAEARNFHIVKKRLWGGRRFPTIEIAVDANEQDDIDSDFYFLLLDCSSEDKVVSAIRERYEGLTANGFTTIIGVRDLAPSFRRDQLERLFEASMKSLQREPVDPLLVVAVMEMEAWFIAEATHFAKVDPSLTRQCILDKLNIDIEADAEEIERPSHALPKIYDLAGVSYDKTRADLDRTIAALDLKQYNDQAAFLRAKSVQPLFDRLRAVLLPADDLDRTA